MRILAVIDEYSRECLSIDVARRLRCDDVLERLSDLFVHRGVPEHIRSDNGSEFTAKALRQWLSRLEVRTLYIEPGSPWENGYVESFIGKLRDKLLDREVFDTLLEAKVLVERWRRHYNQVRPHSWLRPLPPLGTGWPKTNLTTGTTIGGRSLRTLRMWRLNPRSYTSSDRAPPTEQAHCADSAPPSPSGRNSPLHKTRTRIICFPPNPPAGGSLPGVAFARPPA